MFDIFGGTLFKDFIDFLVKFSVDTINLITGGLTETPPPPPPPPPPPIVQYVLVGTYPALTVIGADDPGCTLTALTDPCPGVLIKSPAFQELTDSFVKFDFHYNTLDDDSTYDPAGYFIEDELFRFTDDSTQQTQEGFNHRFSVLAGQTYGFYVDSFDQALGAATLDISNIGVFVEVRDSSQDVPEPASLTLTSLALIALIAVRKRKQKF